MYLNLDYQSDTSLIHASLSAFYAVLDCPGEEAWSQNGFRQCVALYKAKRVLFNYDFHRRKLYDHPELDPLINKILIAFEIPLIQRNRYIGMRMTLNEFFLELDEVTKGKHPPLKQFIKIIDEFNHTQIKNVLAFALIGSGVGSIPFFLYGLTLLDRISYFIPGWSLIYATTVNAYFLFEYIRNKSTSLHELFQDNCFIFANYACTVSAWLVLMTTASTPLGAALFILADFVFVIKESLNVISLYSQKFFDLSLEPFDSSIDLFSEQHCMVRDAFEIRRARYAALIHLTAVMISVSIISVWCLSPGGVFVVAGCLLGIGLLHLVKKYLISQNEKNIKILREKTFDEIESKPLSNVSDIKTLRDGDRNRFWSLRITHDSLVSDDNFVSSRLRSQSI